MGPAHGGVLYISFRLPIFQPEMTRSDTTTVRKQLTKCCFPHPTHASITVWSGDTVFFPASRRLLYLEHFLWYVPISRGTFPSSIPIWHEISLPSPGLISCVSDIHSQSSLHFSFTAFITILL